MRGVSAERSQRSRDRRYEKLSPLSESPISPHLATPAELKERIEAERRGGAFVIFREERGVQRIVPLAEGARELTIGRDEEADIPLPWDPRVSSVHAELRRAGATWLSSDDGLSRNGTFVNGERVMARMRLRDGDELQLGATVVVFRSPLARGRQSTLHSSHVFSPPEVSAAQRRVLLALCRPCGGDDAFARPATNKQIADELHLTIAAVKTHLRTLFQRFGIDDLAQNEKRAELVRVAFRAGAVSSADLRRLA